MPETDRWLIEYGNSHCNVGHPGIYWPAVLLLVPATVGMFWLLLILVFVVSSMGTVNTLVMNVLEQTREFGVFQ